MRRSFLAKCCLLVQVYSVEDSPLCLTGTAEVPLAGIHADKIMAEEQLPIRMAAFGHCFRTEAGSGGTASKGLYRVHQLSKVGTFHGLPHLILADAWYVHAHLCEGCMRL